jgi:uncharacterized membrane protein YjjP (DUF1212 family)
VFEEKVAAKQAGESAREAIGYLMRLGRALHSNGYGAEEVEHVLQTSARRLGLKAQFFSVPTTIIAAFGPQDQQETLLMRVQPGETDLGRLADLNSVSSAVLRAELSPGEGAARVDAIVATKRIYRPWLRTLGYALASAASARFLGGGLDEIVVAAIIGLAVGGLSLWMEPVPHLARIFLPTAAFLASAMATAATVIIGPIAGYITMLAGIIVLLPGLTLTLAISELSANHLVSGTARLSSALVQFLGLGFGAALGVILIQAAVSPDLGEQVEALPVWTSWVAVAVAASGFTIVYRAKPRDFVWILIVSAMSYGANRLGAHAFSPQVGAFLGALTVGLASNLYAQFLRRPEMVTQVPGILLLVPGSIGFHGLAAMLDKNVETGFQSIFQMGLTAIALAAGLVLANEIFPKQWRKAIAGG